MWQIANCRIMSHVSSEVIGLVFEEPVIVFGRITIWQDWPTLTLGRYSYRVNACLCIRDAPNRHVQISKRKKSSQKLNGPWSIIWGSTLVPDACGLQKHSQIIYLVKGWAFPFYVVVLVFATVNKMMRCFTLRWKGIWSFSFCRGYGSYWIKLLWWIISWLRVTEYLLRSVHEIFMAVGWKCDACCRIMFVSWW